MRQHWRSSLRIRLMVGTLVGVLAALGLAGVVLSNLFRDEALRQFRSSLRIHLDQLSASFDIDEAGQPILGTEPADARWQRPLSGLYWQIDSANSAGPAGQVVTLRSRSLWDAALKVPVDTGTADGEVHLHDITGPGGAHLLVMERLVRPADHPGTAWWLRVAADTREMDESVTRFERVLTLSLLVLAAALLAGAGAQLAVGLAPLRSLQAAVTGVRQGRLQRLEGEFPAELQPLIDDFNGVLDQNAQVVARARTQAGNLAHAIKTPLAVLSNAAARADVPSAELARLVDEQVEQARRQVNWHLARARAAASVGVPGLHTQVAAVTGPLVRVMRRVHAQRALALDDQTASSPLSFAGEEQDLQEMLGNLLDNACKWAGARVAVGVSMLEPATVSGSGALKLQVTVDDDGPGLPAALHDAVLARGTRADEQVPGSGLGLAIVKDLAELYGGALRLGESPLGGLRAVLVLPAAA